MMTTDSISNTSLKLSRLVLGMWHINELRDNELNTLVETALDQGITSFDHADIYGNYQCEKKFGNWLKEYSGDREGIQLISKCGIKLLSDNRPDHRVKHYDTSKTHIIQSVDNSLTLLNTDYLDLLLIHRPDPLMNPDEVASAFGELVSAGKVKYVGVSNFTPRQFGLLQASCDMPLVTNQIEISLSHYEPMFDGTLDYLYKRKIQPMAWSPLGGSNEIKQWIKHEKVIALSKKYGVDPGEIILSWLLQHPSGVVPILGTMNPERLKAAKSALNINWDIQDWFMLLELSRGHEVA